MNTIRAEEAARTHEDATTNHPRSQQYGPRKLWCLTTWMWVPGKIIAAIGGDNYLPVSKFALCKIVDLISNNGGRRLPMTAEVAQVLHRHNDLIELVPYPQRDWFEVSRPATIGSHFVKPEWDRAGRDYKVTTVDSVVVKCELMRDSR